MKTNKKGFTLVEIMLGILIFAIVMTGGFYMLSSLNYGKIKIIEATDITKDTFYFSQKLFEEIKMGGTLDYEEYFNRKVIGTGSLNGHYSDDSGFGNFGQGGAILTTNYGNGFYYCRSTATSMGKDGCYNNGFNTTSASLGTSQQRFGQYAFQFIDYNSNLNGDSGDENGDGNIRGDDDDENLGEGPTVFDSGSDVKELYLISGDKKKRTYFRWNWKADTKKPTGIPNCVNSSYSDGCLGNIQMLKLVGKDRGMDHNGGSGYNDGIIDTWILDPDVYGTSGNRGFAIVAGSENMNNYWLDMFPDSITVTKFKVFAYPNIAKDYNFKSNVESENINPYVRIQATLLPSRKKRGSMKGIPPEINISTTINLSDYFSK